MRVVIPRFIGMGEPIFVPLDIYEAVEVILLNGDVLRIQYKHSLNNASERYDAFRFRIFSGNVEILPEQELKLNTRVRAVYSLGHGLLMMEYGTGLSRSVSAPEGAPSNHGWMLMQQIDQVLDLPESTRTVVAVTPP